MNFVQVFIHDPLYKWALSPLKALQRQKVVHELLKPWGTIVECKIWVGYSNVLNNVCQKQSANPSIAKHNNGFMAT